jgi:hypothetical protein
MRTQSETRNATSEAEPPSNGSDSLFLIGKDSRGRWVVQDRNGLRGGLFVSRADALKFALFENGNRPEAVITVPGVLELDMSGSAFAPVRAAAEAEAYPVRRAA